MAKQRVARLLVSSMIGGVLLVGISCSSSSSDPSASEQVCDARTDLRSSLETVADDVRAGNFGQARDNFGEVTESYDQLDQATDGLVAEQRQALAPDVEQLGNDVRSLTSVRSLDELSTTLSTIETGVRSISDEIGSSLDCA